MEADGEPRGRGQGGRSPSVASVYRALAEREAYPGAVAQAHADFAPQRGVGIPRPCPFLAATERAAPVENRRPAGQDRVRGGRMVLPTI